MSGLAEHPVRGVLRHQKEGGVLERSVTDIFVGMLKLLSPFRFNQRFKFRTFLSF